MNKPTEADIEAAKDYIKQRIEVEQSMTYLLESAMREAAERIVDICYGEGVSPLNFSYANLSVSAQYNIDEVIKWLQETIDDYFLTFAVADHEENRDAILPLILGKRNGATFEERLNDYCDKYRDELMLLIGAGLFLGVAKSVLVKSIGENLRHPYANQLLADGIAAPLTYGKGRSNSMYNAISGLTGYGIADAWMRHWELKTAADGCIGWVVRRGSSYPCDICDDNCGFHPADEGTGLPVHGHCACFAVPVYLK